jgi:hypothetical protein
VTDYVLREGRRIEVEVLETNVAPRRRRVDRHIGCPREWLKRVLPLLKSKEQLAVALWLQRRRVVCGSELFTVPNEKLQEELGLSRKVKYRALHYLEKAGVVAIIHDNGKHAAQVRLLW